MPYIYQRLSRVFCHSIQRRRRMTHSQPIQSDLRGDPRERLLKPDYAFSLSATPNSCFSRLKSGVRLSKGFSRVGPKGLKCLKPPFSLFAQPLQSSLSSNLPNAIKEILLSKRLSDPILDSDETRVLLPLHTLLLYRFIRCTQIELPFDIEYILNPSLIHH